MKPHLTWISEGFLIHTVIQLAQDNSQLSWSMGWNKGGRRDGFDWKRLHAGHWSGDLWSSKEIQVRKRKQEQDANQPRAKCLYASYCDQCVAVQFACVGGPETPKLKVYCAGLECTFLYSSHTLVAKTGKMSRGVYYMLQFTDTQSKLSAPRTHWMLLFLPELSFHFMDHKSFSVCVQAEALRLVTIS